MQGGAYKPAFSGLRARTIGLEKYVWDAACRALARPPGCQTAAAWHRSAIVPCGNGLRRLVELVV